MRRVAFAKLRQPARAWQRMVELVELDLPASTGEARFVVTVRQGALSGDVVMATQESSLTATPCPRAEAGRRARDFIARRLAAGDTLTDHDGFDGLAAPAAPETRAAAAPIPSRNLTPVVASLVARFGPDRWKLEPAARRARSVWRVAERSDSAVASADQQALVALVPRLIDLLETGDDLLDLCIAVAIARLGDRGAAQAMQHLAERGRSGATKRAAHQAWLLLQTPEAQRTHAGGLLPGWQLELHGDGDLPELATQLDELLTQRHTGWVQLLGDWYDVALSHPKAHTRLLTLLEHLALRPGPFQALRYLYKAAEIRRDAAVIGVLHARLESTPAYFSNHSDSGHGRGFFSPETRKWVKNPVKRELAQPDSRLAYTSRTRDYLRLRAWRQLRRLAEINHSHASTLAVQLLLGLKDDELPAASEEARWSMVNGSYTRGARHHHPAAGWLLVPKLLLGQWPDVHVSARATRWWTTQPLDTSAALPERSDGLQAMWDAHPEALLTLALHSRAALVHAVVARALRDHAGFVAQQDASVLRALLRSPYAPTARTGFEAAKARIQQATDSAEQVPWLVLLVQSTDEAAREFAFVHIASDPARFAAHADLVVALLLSDHERTRRQGQGLALIAKPAALVAELQGALLAADVASPGLTAGLTLIEALLRDTLAEAAAQAPVEPLLCLLDHPSSAVLDIAVSWLLLHQHAAALVPAATLMRLLSEADHDRRASGVRLLAALPDVVLLTQAALLGDLATHAHAGIRAAIAPALHRLAAADLSFAETLAQRLHAALFATEAGEGAHDDALQWLTTELQAHAPARDPSGTWRALQAQSRGAQRYGAWALAALPASAFSLKQQATLARHADASVRAWAMQAIDTTLPPIPTPDQSAQLLPLADTTFDDSRVYAHQLFSERLSDASLGVELLIAWIDHPQAWVQSLGRMRLVRQMQADEASLCLTRLSQHPSTEVQLFITQWLLELPRDDKAAVAERLRGLQPYFVTVLSHVNRARAAKTRITEFLRSVTDAPETAAVVAEIFARQVVTASLTDKPQFIAGLRDIAARHPQIALPFMSWQTHTAQPIARQQEAAR